MQVTFDIPEGIKNRVLDAVCSSHDYRATVKDANGLDIPNPVTKGQFVKGVIIAYLKATVSSYEQDVAVVSARDAAKTKADSEITIT